MTDDAELLRRYASDNSDAAFTELVHRHLGFVYQTALRYLQGDTHGAEDVAQLVFTDLARKAASLAGRPYLAGWLHTSARYAALQRIRSESRRQHREQEARVMEDLTHDEESGVDLARLRPVIDEALHELSALDREAVLLRYFEDLEFADVGRRLALTDRASRARVERAIVKMQALLARRGITSTVTALTLAVSAQSAAGAPAGLADCVAGRALESAAASSGGTAAFTLGQLVLMKISVATLAGSLATNAFFTYLYVKPANASPPVPTVSWVAPVASGSPAETTRPVFAALPGDYMDPEAVAQRLRAAGFSERAVSAGIRGAVNLKVLDQTVNQRLKERRTRWNLTPISPINEIEAQRTQRDEAIALERSALTEAYAKLGFDSSGNPLMTVYPFLPRDKAVRVRQLEEERRSARSSAMSVVEVGPLRAEETEFEASIEGILSPQEAQAYFRHTSTAAADMRRTMAPLGLPAATLDALADAAIASDRQARAGAAERNSASISQARYGLFESYRSILGEDRFGEVIPHVEEGRYAPMDAVFRQAQLSAAERTDRFMAAMRYEWNRIPGEPVESLAIRAAALHAEMTSALTPEQVQAFDETSIGRTLQRTMSTSGGRGRP